jgi:hypothetical protein
MATSWPTETNQNIQSSTRRLWVRTTIDQVLFKMPLYSRLLMAGGVRQPEKGGTEITRPVITDNLESLGQDYTENEPLEGGSKTLLDTPTFRWKMFQIPVTYGPREQFENAGGSDTQILDMSSFLVDEAQKATRIHLNKLMWDTSSTPGSTDTGRKFQSIIQALDHGTTYGNLARAGASGTRAWWESADIEGINAAGSESGSASTQDTAYAASIETVRKMIDAVSENIESGQQLMGVCGPTLHLKLKSLVQTEHSKANFAGPMAKYGFDSFMIDDVEFVKDPYLKNKNITNSHKWLLILNIPSWNLYLHPQRSFAFTGFKWQGDIENGYDRWLARVMCRGNLVCWEPNSNIWLSNVA